MTGGATYPSGESPGGRLIPCGLGPSLPTCPLTWAEACGWSAPAVCCDTPSAAPPGPPHSLWAAVVRTRLWAVRDTPRNLLPQHKSPYLPATPSLAQAVCLFLHLSPGKSRQRGGSIMNHSGQRGARWPEVYRREGQSRALGGMGSDLPPHLSSP